MNVVIYWMEIFCTI